MPKHENYASDENMSLTLAGELRDRGYSEEEVRIGVESQGYTYYRPANLAFVHDSPFGVNPETGQPTLRIYQPTPIVPGGTLYRCDNCGKAVDTVRSWKGDQFCEDCYSGVFSDVTTVTDTSVTTYILITGNPVDGFTYEGPFTTADEAHMYAEQTMDTDDWWSAPLVVPK